MLWVDIDMPVGVIPAADMLMGLLIDRPIDLFIELFVEGEKLWLM